MTSRTSARSQPQSRSLLSRAHPRRGTRGPASMRTSFEHQPPLRTAGLESSVLTPAAAVGADRTALPDGSARPDAGRDAWNGRHSPPVGHGAGKTSQRPGAGDQPGVRPWFEPIGTDAPWPRRSPTAAPARPTSRTRPSVHDSASMRTLGRLVRRAGRRRPVEQRRSPKQFASPRRVGSWPHASTSAHTDHHSHRLSSWLHGRNPKRIDDVAVPCSRRHTNQNWTTCSTKAHRGQRQARASTASRHAAAKSCIGRSSTSLKQAIVPKAGAGSRPVSILRNVSGDMPAACVTSLRSRSARASRSSPPETPAGLDLFGLQRTGGPRASRPGWHSHLPSANFGIIIPT